MVEKQDFPAANVSPEMSLGEQDDRNSIRPRVSFDNYGAPKGGGMTLRMRVHDKEPIGLALRRFKKLIERSGMQKELRAHQHYEKPSELRRRARLRATALPILPLAVSP